MVAIALPEMDRRKLEQIRDRLSPLAEMDLSDIDLRRVEQVGQEAGRAVDRLTGRSRPSIWPRLVAAIGVAAVVGLAVALVTWSRRSAWDLSTGDQATATPEGAMARTSDLAATTITEPHGQLGDGEPERLETPGPGLTAAESSLMSSDPAEDSVP